MNVLATNQEGSTLLLTDWAATIDTPQETVTSFDAFAFEVIFQSLVFDRILVADEILTLSSRMPDWFSSRDRLDILRKLFDLETLKVLTFPQNYYQTTELQSRCVDEPITARAFHHEWYSSKGKTPFCPTHNQRDWYEKCDRILNERRQARHPIASIRPYDLYGSFAAMLRRLLVLPQYRSWISTTFPALMPVVDDLVGYIDHPELADKIIREKRGDSRPGDGKHFTRSLAYRLASVKWPNLEGEFRSLVQSAFASALVSGEDGVGRYTDFVRECLFFVEKPVEGPLDVGDFVVNQGSPVQTALVAPDMSHLDEYIDAVKLVRETTSGIALRQAVQEGNLTKAGGCWEGVAAEMARRLKSKERIAIVTEARRITNDFIGAMIGDVLCLDVPGALRDIIKTTGKSVFVGSKAMSLLATEARLRAQFEQAFSPRCTWMKRAM
jgi:hypothetical protein